MFQAFLRRGYPLKIIDECIIKLKRIDRKKLLIPKTNLIIKSRTLFYPHILRNYTNLIHKECNNLVKTDEIFLVFPFYKNMYSIKEVLVNYIHDELNNRQESNLKNIILNLKKVISFKRINCLQDFCK